MDHHKNIRLPGKNYVGQNRYFVTICCAGRKRHFVKDQDCEWAVTRLREIAILHSFAVHAYCLMPDHLHLLVQGMKPDGDLLRFMKTFKIKTSRQFAARRDCELWQKKYYDHILREKESTESVAWYIWMNPVRAGIVARPTDYPFIGSFTMNIPEMTALPEAWTPLCRSEKRPPQKAAATTAERSSYGDH